MARIFDSPRHDVLRGFLVQQRKRAGALVARNIRRLRVARGLSQDMLAVDAGIDRTYVSRLERGLENPTVAALEKLARPSLQISKSCLGRRAPERHHSDP
jgi:transcriptional regulator with XRE-family HTH domain